MGRIAAVMVAAVLVLAGCGDDSSSSPSSGRTTGTVARSFACPDPAAKVEAAAGDTLPTGARAARICYSAEMPVEWQPPHEPLTHDVAHLVALVNRQQVYPPADGCNADAGPAYRIVLDYPDGARMISGVTAGCRDVRVGASDREGGRTVWRAYFHLLAQQREHARPGHGADATDLLPHAPASRAVHASGGGGQPRPGQALPVLGRSAGSHDDEPRPEDPPTRRPDLGRSSTGELRAPRDLQQVAPLRLRDRRHRPLGRHRSTSAPTAASTRWPSRGRSARPTSASCR